MLRNRSSNGFIFLSGTNFLFCFVPENSDVFKAIVFSSPNLFYVASSVVMIIPCLSSGNQYKGLRSITSRKLFQVYVHTVFFQLQIGPCGMSIPKSTSNYFLRGKYCEFTILVSENGFSCKHQEEIQHSHQPQEFKYL